MSSTNRSNARDEHISDYYVTPVKDIELFLRKFDNYVSLEWEKMIIVDPTAGGNPKTDKDAYHPMSYPTAIENIYGKCDIRTYDLREDSFAEHKCDYLQIKLNYKPNIIITNPPFAIATDIIEKSINDVEDNGYVIMLLRLNFFGSQSREQFFNKYMPEWVFVHHLRIGFTDKKDKDGCTIYDLKNGLPKKGSTDSIEYAHFVFRKGNKPKYSKLVVI